MSELHGRPVSATSPRTPLLAPSELRPEQTTLYEAILAGPRRNQVKQVPILDDHERLLGPFGLMLITPELGNAVQQLGASLRFNAAFEARCRELAILTAAVTLSSEFEWWAHEHAALAVEITAEQLQQLLDGATPDGLSELERTVVETTRALARSRTLSDDEFAQAKAVLGQELLAELTWLVGYYGMLALALEVFAPPPPTGPAVR